MDENRLVAKDLVKKYGQRTVVNQVSIAIQSGEIVGLLGPNGAGKTTTFYMIVGLIKPDAGILIYNDHDITRLPMPQRARQGISYLPQEASVFRKLTVADNLKAILQTLSLSPCRHRSHCCQRSANHHRQPASAKYRGADLRP